MEIIIILGHTNDLLGEISAIAKSRLNKGYELFCQSESKAKILLTGGFGAHFNITDYPHAHYARAYLLSVGALHGDILSEFALSEHTISDAIECKPIIQHLKPNKIYLVTSDFHLHRAGYIFKTVFRNYDLQMVVARTPHEEDYLKDLILHEKKCIRRLRTEKFLNFNH